MRATIVYDNTAWRNDLQPDWGFSCLVEAKGKRILFDTGGNGSILLSNMQKMGIKPRDIGEVFISHAHYDHTGGLSSLLDQNPDVKIWAPPSFGETGLGEVVKVRDAREIHAGIYSTGELQRVEQSMAVETEKGLAVIAGCSHPGVGRILEAASQFGAPSALIGGLHGFNQFKLLESLDLVCPTHCTQHIEEIESLYPDKCVKGGAGKTIEV